MKLRMSPRALCLAIMCLSWVGAPASAQSVTAGVESRAARSTTTLAVNGRASSTPSIAAEAAFVAVAWSAMLPGGGTDVFASVSRDSAATFGAPVRVNNVAGDARVNGEQPPRIVLARRPTGDRTMHVIWTTRGKDGTKLVSARSDDDGRSFAPAATLPGSDAPGNRGWQNAVATAGGRVYAFWLDHRAMADHSMAAGHHEHGEDPARVKPPSEKPDGVAMAQLSKLYVGSLDGSVPAHAIAPGVCYCCKTAVARGPDGTIYAAWRHVYPGNVRDIAFTSSRDDGRTFAPPIRVSEDKWSLEGCPDDGPAMAVDREGRIHIAWPTLITDRTSGEPTVAVFYASSPDGRRFTPRAPVPTEGVAHHPQIVIDGDGAPVVAWDEGSQGLRRAVIARGSVGTDGEVVFRRTVLGDGPSAVYPVVATSGRAVIAAWTAVQPSPSVIRIQRIETRHGASPGGDR